MAQRPELTNAINNGKGKLTTGNTTRDGTGSDIVTILTAGSNGTLVKRLNLKADGRPADSTVVVYLHDGSAYYVVDEFDVGAPAATANTAATWQDQRAYADLKIPSGWTLRASVTVTPTSGAIHVIAFGENF